MDVEMRLLDRRSHWKPELSSEMTVKDGKKEDIMVPATSGNTNFRIMKQEI